jgi:peptidoglycan/LPS O-acetylase OafA/YrhL
MESVIFLILSTLVIGVASYLKLLGVKACDYQPFDVRATLPIRGVLAILIVCHHVSLSFPTMPSYLLIFTKIGTSVCAVFFFLSGYGLMISYIRKGKLYLNGFFLHRLSKLLPVFFLLTAISIFHAILVAKIELSEIVNNCLHGVPPLKYSWFIYAIILQYIMFYCSCKLSLSKSHCIIYTALLTFIVMIVMCALGWGSNWFVSLPSFVLGMFIASYETQIKTLVSRHLLLSLLVVVGLMIFSLTVILNMFTLLAFAFIPFSNLAPLIVLLAVYAFGGGNNQAINYLGNISLEIYLVHGFILLVLNECNLTWYAYLFGALSITLIVGIFLHKMNEYITCFFLYNKRNRSVID